MKEMKYIGAGSGEQRAKRRAQRAKGEERRAESKREQDLRFVTADCSLHGLPALLTQKEKTGNIEYRITNVESGRNIPVRCTFGFNRISSATKVIGALHLRFPTSGTAISERAAAARNTLSGIRRICSFGYRPAAMKVHSTEILNRDTEHQITLPGFLTGNIKSGNFSGNASPVSDFLFLIIYFLFPNSLNAVPKRTGRFMNETPGRDLTVPIPIPIPIAIGTIGTIGTIWNNAGLENKERRMMNIEYRITNVESGSFSGNPQPGTTTTTTTTTTLTTMTTTKYKANPLLPRGGFTGDCPGAAAITIFSLLFSSLRVSPTRDAEFSHSDPFGTTPHLRYALSSLHKRLAVCAERVPSGNRLPRKCIYFLFPNSLNAVPKRTGRFTNQTTGRDLTVPIPIPIAIGIIGTIGIIGNNAGLENKERRMMNIEYRITNVESGSFSGNPQPGTTTTMTTMTTMTTTKYKANPLLPRGGFSGDCPGAAAITIFSLLFSSLRVSPNFAGAMRYALSGSPNGHITCKPLSAYEPTGLPVTNQFSFSSTFGFIPMEGGREEAFTERRYAVT